MIVDEETLDAARKFGWSIAKTLLQKNTKSTSIIDVFSSVSSVQDLVEALNKATQSIVANGLVPAGLKHLEGRIPEMTNDQAVAVARLIAIEAYRVYSSKNYGGGES